MSDILKELEQDFGKPRKEWSLEEWKQAAIGNSTLRASADVIIQLLEEQVAIFKEYTQHLETRIAQLEKRRIGAPRKPRIPRCALARKRGRPKNDNAEKGSIWAYTNVDYARDLRHVVDGIKARRNIKTDTEALAIIYKTVPLRKRTPLIEYDAKLLSKHRKLIAKIE